MGILWSKEEIKLLHYFYIELGLSLSELSDKFIKNYPLRTYTAIEVKIKKLKLHHTKEQTKTLKSRLNSGENNGMYGKVGANMGLTKENCERIKNAGIKMSETRKILFKEGILDNSGEKKWYVW